jgi:hypothetical protein
VNAGRLPRHWYDLYQLSRSEIGSASLNNTTLLEDVINHKNVLYLSGWAKYDDCLMISKTFSNSGLSLKQQ